jgi:HTH-type transcriptional regulator / antitoxin HigA
MNKISKKQYEDALKRVEELLPIVTDKTLATDKNAIELSMMSDIVIAYEKEHYPIGKYKK